MVRNFLRNMADRPANARTNGGRNTTVANVAVRTSNSWSKGRDLDSRSNCYQAVTTWMGDCLRASKPSRHISNSKVNSAFHPSRVGKSSTGLHGWANAGLVYLCQMASAIPYGRWRSVALWWVSVKSYTRLCPLSRRILLLSVVLAMAISGHLRDCKAMPGARHAINNTVDVIWSSSVISTIQTLSGFIRTQAFTSRTRQSSVWQYLVTCMQYARCY